MDRNIVAVFRESIPTGKTNISFSLNLWFSTSGPMIINFLSSLQAALRIFSLNKKVIS